MTSLELRNIGKRFGEQVAIHRQSIRFAPGITGILGANGAGKSTLFNLIAQVVQPDEGDMFLNGESLSENPEVIRRQLGWLPQQCGVYEHLNCEQFLQYMAAVKKLSRRDSMHQINHLLTQLDLGEVADKPLAQLSGGMKQRLGIAQALLGKPAVVLLDEPTVGLDSAQRMSLRPLLNDLAKQSIVLLSSHIISDIEAMADRILVMAQGRVLFHDTMAALLQQMCGSVWQCRAPLSCLSELTQRCTLVSERRVDGEAHLRVISATPPSDSAVAATPTLDDAWLYFTHTAETSVQYSETAPEKSPEQQELQV